MKVIARGPEFSADPGAVLEVPEVFGRSLVASGAAEEIVAPPAVEAAVAPPAPEEAVADRRTPPQRLLRKR